MRLNEIGVSVMTPCRLLLGKSLNLPFYLFCFNFERILLTKANKPNLIKQKRFWKIQSETKYDGERFQLHKKGDKFVYFSKNFIEKYAENFGKDRILVV